ncbi:ATP-binding cassette domain-containing protein [Streptomyces sodiiphilus]|uniref:ATP-binding cassette domain-containing protein n=1 Tax=Streptomyces sodiiphilus TaxID=226217 RepID=UPI0031DE6A9E
MSDLVQGHGRDPVISGLDLRVGPRAFGLLGPNGAGKSALLRTLATASPPVRGELRARGELVDCERSARRARRHIGYLPQDFGCFRTTRSGSSCGTARGCVRCRVRRRARPRRTRCVVWGWRAGRGRG